jgi:uncharacterized phage protein (TIGR02220 family)
MQCLKIKNWGKFQHFKDRTPPWVKLYRDLLDDPDWHELDGESAKTLIMLWLIASEDETHEGKLPDTRKLAFRLRTNEIKLKQQLIKLEHWLIQDDIKMISGRYQDDAPETETEAEAEAETETEAEASANTSDKIPYKEIIDYLNSKTGKNFSNSSKETRAKIKARWGINGNRRSLQDFKTVIDNKCAQWLKDEKMFSYLRPETLFGTKFESYLQDIPLEIKYGNKPDKTEVWEK